MPRNTVFIFGVWLIASAVAMSEMLRSDSDSISAVFDQAVLPVASANDNKEMEFELLSPQKQNFISHIAPLVIEENEAVLSVHQQLVEMKEKTLLSASDRTLLANLAGEYRLPEDVSNNQQVLAHLLRRIDAVPADLALAQAAIESGWGTSRFAREANNYFGHWCYKKGCGLVPARREGGDRHEVRSFADASESVRAYLKNINTHPAYHALRLKREVYRGQDTMASGVELAEGLMGYSALGPQYVSLVREIIVENKLAYRISGLQLAAGEALQGNR